MCYKIGLWEKYEIFKYPHSQISAQAFDDHILNNKYGYESIYWFVDSYFIYWEGYLSTDWNSVRILFALKAFLNNREPLNEVHK